MRWRVLQVDGVPHFALTAGDYEAMSRNVAEMTRWAIEASYQLDFYRRTRQPAINSLEGVK